MMIYPVNYSKSAQMKIQQMAFVLVAIIIFFAIASLFYFVITLGNLRTGVQSLENEEARFSVKKISSTPEFMFSSSNCENCIDFDKVFLLKNRKTYQDFWGFSYLMIEKINTGNESKECNFGNYPDCNKITIIEKEEIGSPSSAFVSLCKWHDEKGGYYGCELGRIYASGRGINE